MHRVTLDNGLRVVVDHRQRLPIASVCLHYDVGFRSEEPNQAGFAHLFEHLMFQGGDDPGGDHVWQVQAAGGVANASTAWDFTEFYQAAPDWALERMLYLESERMRAPSLTERDLANQVRVVKEEIRQNVANRPYGGFPWTTLPGLLYRSFGNAHNGYGDFESLDSVTLPDCHAFFRRHYAPGNAVLTLSGPTPPARAVELVERYFADIPARPVPSRPVLDEEPAVTERHGWHSDPHAPLPALAIGYRLPDPAVARADYLAHVVLAALLTAPEEGRLRQRLVAEHGLAADLRATCGFFGPLQTRDPDTFVIVATHPDGVTGDEILAAIDAELAAVAEQGFGDAQVRRAAARVAAGICRAQDAPLPRARRIGAFELLFGEAELVDELPDRIREVSAGQVGLAAKTLQRGARAVLQLTPGGQR